MRRRKPGRFTVREVNVTERGVTYTTFRVAGWIRGLRVRKQFTDRAQALAELNRLEVQASNAGGIVARNTRLTENQIAEAEIAFAKLGGRSLPAVVEWYLANYRPPAVDQLLSEAIPVFLASRKAEVEFVHWDNMRRRLAAFSGAFPGRLVHTLTTSEIAADMAAQGWQAKTWNLQRGVLHSFFNYCAADDRRWVTKNPITALAQQKVARGLPHIETPGKIAELFKYLEGFTGGTRKPSKAGFLVPYFAFATFAGMRPAILEGEVCKLGLSPDLARLVNVDLGVIHVTPQIAKTDVIRQIKIRPNLAAWLRRYPLADYPIVVTNMQDFVSQVRKKFDLGHDVLRHTFISNHVAQFKSLGEAALEAGNSESIIRRHYLNLVSEADAAAFWKIAPS